MASFVSSKDLDAARAEKRLAREKLLREEEGRFLAKKEAKKRHKESGNDRWMLPEIEKRIETDASKLSKVSSVKKSKKKKKRKKKGSSESSSSDSEEQWEEKSSSSKDMKLQVKETTNWLNFDDIVSGENTYTSKSIKEQKEAEKASSRVNTDDLVGQHPKELNPYWKEGGTGLPSEEKASENKTTGNKVHKEWLLRSLKRMTEQAKEQNRSIESIAAERYGSWQEFQSLLRQAEPERRRGSDRRGYHKHQNEKKSNTGFMRPKDDDEDGSHSRHHHRKQDRRESGKRHREDHRPAWKKRRECSKSPDRDKRRKDERRSLSPRRSQHPSWKKNHKESTKYDKMDQRKQSPSPERHHSRPSQKERNTESHKTSSKQSLQPTDALPNDKKKKVPRILGPERPPLDPTADSPQKLPASESGGVNTQGADESHKSLEKIGKVKDIPAKIAAPKAVILSEKEKNQLAAKILKAELMGNDKLATSLKSKLEKARAAESVTVATSEVTSKPTERQRESSSSSSEEETVVLTRVGKDGQSWPLQHSDMAYDSLPNKKRKKKKVPTHASDGKRERYFADDDRHSLEDLVRREKTEEAEDQHAMFSRLASKQFQGTDSEYFTLDDMYVSEASRKNTRTEEEARQKQKAIADHKKLAKRLEKCRLCFGNPELPKHLLIAIGKKCYLALPDHKPLTEGHCIIAPMHHCNTGTALDEDVWAEVKQFMRALQDMFKSKELDCVFMQTCMGLKKSRHFFVDCTPLPIEEGDMAPIYFKKAIQESESEWSHNKKLIDTRGKDVQKCVPKGLPYFSVEFGMDGGFAHVVEDEALFPFYFGREIVGGMLDVEPRLWRHPPKDHFSEQTKRSVKFSEWWKPFDWTTGISGMS